ncbi:hypothetical protein LBMAG53_34800 [Planctomycetota bacterium]|nr:hypothetical protein LBMAG53_34800 [Planctomycetota bacterium]
MRQPLTDEAARLLSWDFAREHRETRSLAGWARRWTRFVIRDERPIALNWALLLRPFALPFRRGGLAEVPALAV